RRKSNGLIFTIGLGFLLLGLTASGFAATTGVDALIEKLVEKGILNRQEGISLKGEIAEDEKLVREEGLKQDLPNWVRDTKLKGDFRMRYQRDRKRATATQNEKSRFRMRFGTESKVNDQTEVYFGLASGSSTDPRSTNQTLQDSFAKKSVYIDHAYASYTPAAWATLFAGRMKNPVYQTGDMLWDTDINPEGIAVQLKHALGAKADFFMNNAFFILDDTASPNGTGADPAMFVIQPGIALKVNDKTKLKLAGAYYGFNSVKNQVLDNSSGTNTLSGQGTSLLNYDFDSWSVSSELGIKEPLKIGFIPYIAVFGDYIENMDPSTENIGYIAGFKFGNEKVANWKQWQAKYMYRSIGKDAVLDIFPDSDAYGGFTDVKAHEYLLSYGLNKNVTLDLDYYQNDRIKAAKNKEKLLQVDLNFKF
ncbi:MAG: putative porin, partial [Candidatus Omnitrophota bacterium]